MPGHLDLANRVSPVTHVLALVFSRIRLWADEDFANVVYDALNNTP